MEASSLADNKYVSITTFRKDGTPKPVPVWITEVGNGTVGFTTASSSWKVKRLANNPKVLLQPSDSRGRVVEGSTAVTGSARVAVGGPEFERVKNLVRKKYGIQHALIGGFGKFMSLIGRGSGSDAAVIITLD